MTHDVEALLARLEVEATECENWDQDDRGELHRDCIALIRNQAAEIERLKIEIYGLPAPKDGKAISIFDLPKGPCA